MARMVSASAIALYDGLGYSSNNEPKPFSQEKLDMTYTHSWKVTGHLINSRSLTVGLLEYE